MKGKRYLRAPNTSAASVRRRRRAHKNERRLIDRAEEGYDVDPGDDGKAPTTAYTNYFLA